MNNTILTIKNYRKKHGLCRIVTSERGSWRWQAAYRVAAYKLVRLKNKKLAWQSYNKSQKFSWPQLKKSGYAISYKTGTAHNHTITNDDVKNYADLAIARDAITLHKVNRYLRLAAKLINNFPALQI